jgi:diguanylate cyclase (GGDEF)-like protein/PAS domain S-box-containing protein
MGDPSMRILLVEDEEPHIALIRRAFSVYPGSWTLDVVRTLAEAQMAVVAAKPDLAIVDLVLPDGQGIDLLPVNAEERPYPVMVLTGQGDEQIAVEAMKAGAFDYVVKSESSMAALPRIATRVLREWELVIDRRRAEAAQKESEERYRTLVEDMPFMICRYKVNGELTFVNQNFSQYISQPSETLLGQIFFDLVPEEVRQIVKSNLASLTPTNPVTSYEYPIFKVREEIIWQRWTNRALFDESGRLVEYQSLGEDITQRKQTEQQLRKLATHDFLTGLPNRRLFQERLEVAITKAEHYQQDLALLYLDLDQFKAINDSFGHENGDKVLQGVADRLQNCMRGVDTLARLGGDEFAVIVDQTNTSAKIEEVITHISGCFTKPYIFNHQQVSLTASIGVAVYPRDAQDPLELLKQADNAMYVAKEKGKNQYHFPTP